MKQALEALSDFDYDKRMSAITSLRQFIAEAEKQDGNCQQCGGKGCVACDAREQEPAATVTSETGADITMSWWHEPALPIGTKLYTHPQLKREWIGLTDEEIGTPSEPIQPNEALMFARVIESLLKEKNQ